jgi:hypothetical protein
MSSLVKIAIVVLAFLWLAGVFDDKPAKMEISKPCKQGHQMPNDCLVMSTT